MKDNEEIIWMEARLADMELALSNKNSPLFDDINSAKYVEGVKWVCPVVEDAGPLPFKDAVMQRIMEMHPDTYPSQIEWRVCEAWVRSQSDMYPKLTWWQKLKEKISDFNSVGYAFGYGDVVNVKGSGVKATVVKWIPNIAQYRCKVFDSEGGYEQVWFSEYELEKPY